MDKMTRNLCDLARMIWARLPYTVQRRLPPVPIPSVTEEDSDEERATARPSVVGEEKESSKDSSSKKKQGSGKRLAAVLCG